MKVWAAIPIGKEADNLEERELFGEDDQSIEWGLVREDRRRLFADIEELLDAHDISDRNLIETARVSGHTLSALRKGRRVAFGPNELWTTRRGFSGQAQALLKKKRRIGSRIVDVCAILNGFDATMPEFE
ncbi:hypothetical protein [Phenylobacterium sp.]|uniref:hypothetical protein n=1 Tax=Phenylobacterium sp. TaxID=1871053 RepID=UPI0025E7D826|nr:hypothetical protein [Phenylobacterium sp.]